MSRDVAQAFADVDAFDPEKFVAHLAPDAKFRFANADPVTGRSAIAAAVGGFFSTIDGLKHHIRNTWEFGDTVIVQIDVEYFRKDGKSVSQQETVARPAGSPGRIHLRVLVRRPPDRGRRVDAPHVRSRRDRVHRHVAGPDAAGQHPAAAAARADRSPRLVTDPVAPGHLDTAGVATAVIDTGPPAGAAGPPALLLHGSGPGVTATANWRPVIPALSAARRVIAPDQLGSGGTAAGDHLSA